MAPKDALQTPEITTACPRGAKRSIRGPKKHQETARRSPKGHQSNQRRLRRYPESTKNKQRTRRDTQHVQRSTHVEITHKNTMLFTTIRDLRACKPGLALKRKAHQVCRYHLLHSEHDLTGTSPRYARCGLRAAARPRPRARQNTEQMIPS